jgi:hypothetical protein
MFETIREDAQGKGLNAVDRFLAALAVTQYARELQYLGEPAAIVFLFDFNGQRQDPRSFQLASLLDHPIYPRIHVPVKEASDLYLLSSDGLSEVK